MQGWKPVQGLSCGLAIVALASCEAKEAPLVEPDVPVASRTLEGVRLGEPSHAGNLTVWPVFADEEAMTPELLTLHEASARETVEIRENGAGSGRDESQVGRLECVNTGELPILILAGTVVQGGKQDRQIAVDTIVAAGETVPLDAFCVEQGRWNATREGEQTHGVFEVSPYLAMKQVRASGVYLADQSAVWSNVSMNVARAGERTSTGTLSAALDTPLDEDLDTERVATHFASTRQGGQAPLGFAYAINGEPIGMRTFANAELFARSFDPFVRTMCLEAQLVRRRDAQAGREPHAELAKVEAMTELVRGITAAPGDVRTSTELARVVRGKNGWGGRSVCEVRASGGGWTPCTRDWTAAVQFSEEAKGRLMSLGYLGYSGAD